MKDIGVRESVGGGYQPVCYDLTIADFFPVLSEIVYRRPPSGEYNKSKLILNLF